MKKLIFLVLSCIAIVGCEQSNANYVVSQETLTITLPCNTKLHMVSEYRGVTYITRDMRPGEVAESYYAWDPRNGERWEIRECEVGRKSVNGQ